MTTTTLLLLLLPLLPLLLLPTPTLSHPTFIQKTCTSTAYYDLCVSSLTSDPASPTATLKGLSTIAINLAVTNATNTSLYASNLSHATTDPTLRSLLTSCSAKYEYARQALQSSVGDVTAQSYDYALLQISAAAEYPGVCKVLFRERGTVYPVEMMKREVALERLCTIAQDIISLLG